MPVATKKCSHCGQPILEQSGLPLCPVCMLAPASCSGGSEERGDDDGASKIGPYRLIEKIGEGGFGVVYRAEQEEPVRREVALKIIKLGMDSLAVVTRFEAERQSLAMMDHPGIAKVFDGGTTERGRPYFVMELVNGMPVTEFCDEKELGTKERLALFRDICRAVGHAHQKGVIHRDIKPSNVLVAMHDGLPVPKVIDFGIAKATEQSASEETMYTLAGQLVGTPVYMSPEQASLDQADIDTRSDIYSLGVLLYELLAGAPPFDSETLEKAGYDEMRRMIREVDPPRPSAKLTVDVRLGPDLDWIVMKAIAKERDRRYDTAGSLGEDVRRYLESEPVIAAAPSLFYRFRKFSRRNRTALVATAAVVVAMIAGTIVSTIQAVRANEAKLVAEKSQEETERSLAAEAESRWKLEFENYASNIHLASSLIASGEDHRAAALLWRQPKEKRGWEWGYLMAQVRAIPSMVWQTGHGSMVDLVTTNRRTHVVTASLDGRIAMWEITSGRKRWECELTDSVMQIAASPSGGRLAVVTSNRRDRRCGLFVLERDTGSVVHSNSFEGYPWAGVHWFDEGIYLHFYDAREIGRMARIDGRSWEVLAEKDISLNKVRIQSKKYLSNDGSVSGLLVFGTPDVERRNRELRVLDLHTLKLGDPIHKVVKEAVIPFADGSKGWAVFANKEEVFYQREDGSFQSLHRHGKPVSHFEILGSHRIAVAYDDEILILLRDGTVETQWKTPEPITGMKALGGGRVLVGDRTGFMRIYRFDEVGKLRHAMYSSGGTGSQNVFFAPNGRQLGFMPSPRNKVSVIEACPSADGGATTIQVDSDSSQFLHAASDVPGFHPQTGEFAFVRGQQLHFIDALSGSIQPSRSVDLPPEVTQFRFDSNGNRLWILSQEGLAVMNAASGEREALIEDRYRANITSLDVTEDGRLVAVSLQRRNLDGRWFMLDATTGEVLLERKSKAVVGGNREGAESASSLPSVVAFDSMGVSLAVGFNSGAIEIWDISTRTLRRTLKRDRRPISVLQFQGDGRRLLGAGGDRILRLYDSAYGHELLSIDVSRVLKSVAVSGDGLAIAHEMFEEKPGLTVHFAAPWWFEQDDPEFYEALHKGAVAAKEKGS